MIEVRTRQYVTVRQTVPDLPVVPCRSVLIDVPQVPVDTIATDITIDRRRSSCVG